MRTYVRRYYVRPSWFKLNTSPALYRRGHSDCNPCPSTMEATSETQAQEDIAVCEGAAKRKNAPTAGTQAAKWVKKFCQRCALVAADQPSSATAPMSGTPAMAVAGLQVSGQAVPPRATPMNPQTDVASVKGSGGIPQTGTPPGTPMLPLGPQGMRRGSCHSYGATAHEPPHDWDTHFAVSPTADDGFTRIAPTRWNGECTIILECADVITHGSRDVQVSCIGETNAKVIKIPGRRSGADTRRFLVEPGRSGEGLGTNDTSARPILPKPLSL